MINDLVKATNEPTLWKACADELNAVLMAIDVDAARRKPNTVLSEKDAEAERAKAMEEARKAIQAMNYAQWPANRTHYTLGQLDTDRLILCCERGLLNWQAAFNAKASFGQAEDMPRFMEQAKLNGVNLELVNPFRFAAKPVLLVAGLRHEGNIETVAQLLKMGADPAQDNGGVFQTAVIEGRPDIGRVIARYGQGGLLNISQWVEWAKASRKIKAYEDFKQIQWEYGRFTATDAETLIETKPLPENSGNLRIIYNFAARRVEEIHEFANPRQNVVNGFTFEDYGQAALEYARDKLIEMGGRPSDLEAGLRGKPNVVKPSVFGLAKG